MKYLPLLTITVKHNFYDSGLCPDFSVTADAKTVGLLNNHRCVVKPEPYGLTVYVPVENQQALIPFVDNSLLFFDFKLQDSDFALYTDQRLKISNPTGLTLYQKDLSIIPPEKDLIIINPVNPMQSILTTPKVNEPLLSISFQRNFNQIKATPEKDEFSFFPKPVLWFYYLVTDQGNSDQFAIVDVGQDIEATTWQRREQLPDDNIYTNLAKQYPSMTIVCFVCEQTLDCRESCTKHLQLKLGEHIVFEHLPSPCYRNYFHIKTDTGSKPTDAIYEIVKYFNNTILIKG